MDKAKEKLVVDNLAFVGHMAKKFRGTGIEYKELVAIGNLALVKAAERFDAGRGIHFLSFAGKCITNEILLECRQKKKMEATASMEETVHENGKGGDPLRICDMLPCEEDGYGLVEESDWRMSLGHTGFLTEKERRAVILFLDGYTQDAAGREIGVSQSYVGRLIKSASGKLYRVGLIGRG